VRVCGCGVVLLVSSVGVGKVMNGQESLEKELQVGTKAYVCCAANHDAGMAWAHTHHLLMPHRFSCVSLPPSLPGPKMLETHQKGIHDALVGMEGEAERLYREERPLLDDESRWAGLGGMVWCGLSICAPVHDGRQEGTAVQGGGWGEDGEVSGWRCTHAPASGLIPTSPAGSARAASLHVPTMRTALQPHHTHLHPSAPAPCRERDQLYERAEKVGALLTHLGEQLKEAIADVNDSTGGCEGAGGQAGRAGVKAGGWGMRDHCRAAGDGTCASDGGPLLSAHAPASHPCSSAWLSPVPAPYCVCPAAASLGDAATPLGKAVRILNNQLQALSQVRLKGQGRTGEGGTGGELSQRRFGPQERKNS